MSSHATHQVVLSTVISARWATVDRSYLKKSGIGVHQLIPTNISHTHKKSTGGEWTIKPSFTILASGEKATTTTYIWVWSRPWCTACNCSSPNCGCGQNHDARHITVADCSSLNYGYGHPHDVRHIKEFLSYGYGHTPYVGHTSQLFSYRYGNTHHVQHT